MNVDLVNHNARQNEARQAAIHQAQSEMLATLADGEWHTINKREQYGQPGVDAMSALVREGRVEVIGKTRTTRYRLVERPMVYERATGVRERILRDVIDSAPTTAKGVADRLKLGAHEATHVLFSLYKDGLINFRESGGKSGNGSGGGLVNIKPRRAAFTLLGLAPAVESDEAGEAPVITEQTPTDDAERGEPVTAEPVAPDDGRGLLALDVEADFANEHRQTNGRHFGIRGPGTSAEAYCPLCRAEAEQPEQPVEATPEPETTTVEIDLPRDVVEAVVVDALGRVAHQYTAEEAARVQAVIASTFPLLDRLMKRAMLVRKAADYLDTAGFADEAIRVLDLSVTGTPTEEEYTRFAGTLQHVIEVDGVGFPFTLAPDDRDPA